MRQASTNAMGSRWVNHFEEMTGAVENRIFEFDIKSWFKGILEDCMLTEFEERIVGVSDHVRDGELRTNSRNGFYYRSLQTVHGVIKDLKIPRPRIGGFTPFAFQKYERREKSLNKLLVECYWRGISTRDMTHVMHQIADVHVSSSVVTRLTKKWNTDARRFHERTIGDEYVYLMLDGIWIKNRSFGNKKRRLVLVAYGVKEDGSREIIDYKLEFSESSESWQQFLTTLAARGLEGKKLALIVSDGCKGIANAIALVYPLVHHQLCWAHKMRNILKLVKTKDQDAVHEGLSKIFEESTTTKKQVTQILWAWRKGWRSVYPKAVACLERDMEKLTYYLDLPKEHHKAIRTSNHIERQFKEFRRRLRSMEVLPNKGSAERALFALTQIRNEKLKAYPLKAFTHKNLH